MEVEGESVEVFCVADGTTVTLSRSCAMLFTNLQIADDLEGTIPTNVSASTFRNIQAYYSKFYQQATRVRAAGQKSEPAMDGYDREFFESLQLHDAFPLILACIELDAPTLLRCFCNAVADVLRGRTVDEVRACCGVLSDWTLEEERFLRERYPWAYHIDVSAAKHNPWHVSSGPSRVYGVFTELLEANVQAMVHVLHCLSAAELVRCAALSQAWHAFVHCRPETWRHISFQGHAASARAATPADVKVLLQPLPADVQLALKASAHKEYLAARPTRGTKRRRQLEAKEPFESRKAHVEELHLIECKQLRLVNVKPCVRLCPNLRTVHLSVKAREITDLLAMLAERPRLVAHVALRVNLLDTPKWPLNNFIAALSSLAAHCSTQCNVRSVWVNGLRHPSDFSDLLNNSLFLKTPHLALRLGADKRLPANHQAASLQREDMAHITRILDRGVLESLDIAGNGMGSEEAKVLAAALSTNTSLTTLNVLNNRIGSEVCEGRSALLEVLCRSSSLVSLCGMQPGDEEMRWPHWALPMDEDARLFAGELARSNSITAVDLSGNRHLGNRTADALSRALSPRDGAAFNSSVVALDVRDCAMHGAAARGLATAALDQPALRLFCGVPVGALRCAGLTALDLSREQLGPLGLLVLSKLLGAAASLTSLVLDNNKLAGQHLRLRPSPSGEQQVAQEEGLEALGEALKESTTLTHLSLRGNDIGPRGAAALSPGLALCSSLRTLILSGNPLFHHSHEPTVLSTAFVCTAASGGTVSALNILHCKLGVEEAAIVVDAFERSPTLKTLCGLTPQMEELNLSNRRLCPGDALLLAADLRKAAFSASLTAVNVLGSELTVEGVAPLIAAFETSDALKTLCGLIPNSEGKCDRSNRQLGPGDALLLAADLKKGAFHPSLTALNVLGNAFTERGAAAVIAAAEQSGRVKRLCGLSLRSCGPDAQNGIQGLEDGMLVAADIKQGAFDTSASDVCLHGGSNLPVGSLRRNELTELDLRLSTRRSLAYSAQPDGLLLAAALEGNVTLTSLSLPSSGLGARFIGALATWLASNRSLRTLALPGNAIGGNDGVDLAEGFEALSAALSENSSLTSLDLSSAKMGPKGARALAPGLASCGALQALNLSGNFLCGRPKIPSYHVGGQLHVETTGTYDASGIEALGDALSNSGSLQILQLEGSWIGGARGEDRVGGLEALSSFLSRSRSLTSLDVQSNMVGPRGASVLASGLARCGSVQTLSLLGNCLQRAGASAIVTVFEKHATLSTLCGLHAGDTHLDLPRRHLQPWDASLLAADLAKGTVSRSLTTIDLQGNILCGGATYGTYDLGGIKALGVALVSAGTLRSVNVWRNDLQLKGAKALVEEVQKHDVGIKLCGTLLDVRELNLEKSRLGPAEALLLANDLAFNTSLKVLDLAENALCAGGPSGNSGYIALAKALEVNCSLTRLGLRSTHIVDSRSISPSTEVEALGKALKSNSTLQQLDLSENQFSHLDVEAVVEGVVVNKALQFVDLKGNLLRDDHKALAKLRLALSSR
ncbi:hypothetical protein CYMTET_4950 [Cymbomonas tetramitiformis]|uniref:SKP1 component dimerisation domain-containing protein n=1 Tax=Cymbomonas tetramitiformis TaxID=36881 RepID=A0AAE0H054_9CHLO|nr:hypothetical protein CYMTET_4950 [Cymbomonas tetramitiformis]